MKMRLVDANGLFEGMFNEEGNEYQRGWNDALQGAFAALPTVDAVEVVHGWWEKDPEMRRMNGHIYDYRCSNCCSSAAKGCYNNNDNFTNYCPNCGAKMDGGRRSSDGKTR